MQKATTITATDLLYTPTFILGLPFSSASSVSILNLAVLLKKELFNLVQLVSTSSRCILSRFPIILPFLLLHSSRMTNDSLSSSPISLPEEHREMRLNIDGMGYEEPLALGEQMGKSTRKKTRLDYKQMLASLPSLLRQELVTDEECLPSLQGSS